MNKKNYFVLITAACLLSMFLCSHVNADDINTISPMLTHNIFNQADGDTSSTVRHPGFVVAQNTPSSGSDQDLDDELMDEYEDEDVQQSQVPDPLFYFNYGMYGLNDCLYIGVINPVGEAYKAMTPVVVRKGVRNFFHNLLFPVRLVNTFLQGKWSSAGREIKIFLINSTIGIAGFRQTAQNDFNLHTSNEDLGQTFGSWSIGEGFYLVLPVFGPSTLRDAIGLAGDSFLKPLDYVEPWELSLGLKAYEQVNNISFYLGEYEDFKKAAVDPYSAFKNAYIQNRNKKIKE